MSRLTPYRFPPGPEWSGLYAPADGDAIANFAATAGLMPGHSFTDDGSPALSIAANGR
jgi:hypothetical protein